MKGAIRNQRTPGETLDAFAVAGWWPRQSVDVTAPAELTWPW
jgi:hypothetical protein